ncbi:hypothetical protein LTR16_010904, partial [Cryomyces antarcticus]
PRPSPLVKGLHSRTSTQTSSQIMFSSTLVMMEQELLRRNWPTAVRSLIIQNPSKRTYASDLQVTHG